MAQPLLGEYVDGTSADNRDNIVPELRRQIRELEQDLMGANHQIQALERENSLMRNAMTVLRRKLDPFRVVIAAIFGELDVIPVDEAVMVSAPPVDDRKRAVWESWKQKLGGKPADLIDALLVHGEMNAVQLRVAMRCHINSVYEATAKLQKMGLLNKSGGKYSLKQL